MELEEPQIRLRGPQIGLGWPQMGQRGSKCHGHGRERGERKTKMKKMWWCMGHQRLTRLLPKRKNDIGAKKPLQQDNLISVNKGSINVKSTLNSCSFLSLRLIKTRGD